MNKTKEYFLASLVTLSVFSTDLYLSSFKELKSIFGCQLSDIQWSISAYLMGFAFSMLLCAMLSDSIGRKKTIMLGLAVYFFASLICMNAKTLFVFSSGRFFQAFGGCTTSIVTRVIAREAYTGSKATGVLSNMFIIMAISLLLAPVLGGFIQEALGWKGHFVFMAGFSFTLFSFSFPLLQETFTEKVKVSLLFDDFKKKTKEVFSVQTYRIHLFLIVTLWISFFTFISGSSLLFLEYFQKTPSEFGLIYAAVMLGFMIGNFLSKRSERMLSKGVALISLASVLFVSTLWFSNLYLVVFTAFTYMAGLGTVLPISQVKATQDIQSQVSVGFSWMYFMQMIFAAIGGILLHRFPVNPKMPLLVMALIGLVQVFLYFTKIKEEENELVTIS
ncbi:MAG: MFS transporter [Chlamydiota bacterium]|jgi:DHA1 family bicyclomycin/chloramphenicol resistance-like MFS transporter